MSSKQTEFWADYYRRVFQESAGWLDYSNERVQAQTFALAIEAAGPLAGCRCLDVGCGRGQLALCLAALEAGEVVGIDIIAESIEACRREHPRVRWEIGTPENEPFVESLGDFDRIFLLEVLEYVAVDRTLQILWKRLRPGGRLVGVVPNRDDGIVRKTMSKFGGHYAPPGARELADALGSLPAHECWALRGMAFQEDQRLLPYAASAWTTEARWDPPPNRLAFVAMKAASAAAERNGTRRQ